MGLIFLMFAHTTFVFVIFFCMAWDGVPLFIYILLHEFAFFPKWLHPFTFLNNLSGMNNFYESLNLLRILCMFYYMLDIVLFHSFSCVNSPIAEVLQYLLESRASSPFVTCFDGLRDTDWLNRPRRTTTGYSIWPMMVCFPSSALILWRYIKYQPFLLKQTSPKLWSICTFY